MSATARLRARLSEINDEIRAINTSAEAEERNTLTPDEESRYAELRTEREQVEARIAQLEEEDQRRSAAAGSANRLAPVDGQGQPRAVITSEPRTYGEEKRHSYFLDLARVTLARGDGDGGLQAARERLARHERELQVELPAREAARDEEAREQNRRQLRRDGYKHRDIDNAFEKRVNPNRTDGQGGYFVPPLWLIDEYVDLPRFGRATANLCRTMGLPSGTDSINLPKVSTGTTTAIQTSDGGAVSSTDLTDDTVSAGVKTIAGEQDIALQLLDQSPIAFDEVVFADLLADYNAKLDLQVIDGSGASGQVGGILGVSGINSVTYTDATPTLPELWPSLLQGASQVAKERKLPATAVVMTPSMWYWMLSVLDSSNRPLIVPHGASFNALGDGGALEADGPVGVLSYGLPVYIDGNIPSNKGGGTNETRIIEARFSDLYLWEGSMRSRVLTEVLSGTLQVRLQVYNYAAFMGNRRPKAISVLSGTGLIPPAGF